MYAERLGFRPALVFSCGVCLLLAAGFGWMATDPELGPTSVRLTFAGVAAAVAALAAAVLIQASRHPLALRVDHQGVTLGPEPGPFTHQGFWWLASEITVPWHDIEAVVLFSRSHAGAGFSDYIGVRLRDGAQPPPGAQRSFLGFAEDDVSIYRAAFGWSVDENRLASATKKYGRGVRVTNG